jgi:hypothetical protein
MSASTCDRKKRDNESSEKVENWMQLHHEANILISLGHVKKKIHASEQIFNELISLKAI